jgi:hypothetical protein
VAPLSEPAALATVFIIVCSFHIMRELWLETESQIPQWREERSKIEWKELFYSGW